MSNRADFSMGCSNKNLFETIRHPKLVDRVCVMTLLRTEALHRRFRLNRILFHYTKHLLRPEKCHSSSGVTMYKKIVFSTESDFICSGK